MAVERVTRFRGCDNLVYAEVLTDNNEETGGYTTGEVKPLAPVGEISKTTESSSETIPYDNVPAIVITSEGADEITLTVAIPSLATLAEITGKTIDPETGAMIDDEAEPKNFAIGYRLQHTDGVNRFVWRLKGSFAIPDETSVTKGEGTDSNDIQLTYTGITTAHKFTKTGKGAKAVVVDDTADSKADVSAFFETVTTPDTLKKKSDRIGTAKVGEAKVSGGGTAKAKTAAKRSVKSK